MSSSALDILIENFYKAIPLDQALVDSLTEEELKELMTEINEERKQLDLLYEYINQSAHKSEKRLQKICKHEWQVVYDKDRRYQWCTKCNL